MPICSFCGKEMNGNSCFSTIILGGVKYPRVKFGDSELFGDSEYDECPDCGCLPGQFHHYLCDQEECPVCGDQLIACIVGQDHGIAESEDGKLIEVDYDDEEDEFVEEFEDIRDFEYDEEDEEEEELLEADKAYREYRDAEEVEDDEYEEEDE